MRVATVFYGLFSTKCWIKHGFATGIGLCESYYVFFQQNVKKNTVLLRVGLQCSFDMTFFLVITGKNNILPKKCSLRLFPTMTRKLCVCVWLSRYII